MSNTEFSYKSLLADIEDIDQLFRANQSQVAGRLDVDVPSRIARRLIIPALPDFIKNYPKLQLALGSTDRTVDLIEERVDCVIRFGTPQPSSLVVKPLGRAVLVNCASPGYLAKHGTPEHPSELVDGHFAVGYTSKYCGPGAAVGVPVGRCYKDADPSVHRHCEQRLEQ